MAKIVFEEGDVVIVEDRCPNEELRGKEGTFNSLDSDVGWAFVSFDKGIILRVVRVRVSDLGVLEDGPTHRQIACTLTGITVPPRSK